jgi:hypothetical protein
MALTTKTHINIRVISWICLIAIPMVAFAAKDNNSLESSKKDRQRNENEEMTLRSENILKEQRIANDPPEETNFPKVDTEDKGSKSDNETPTDPKDCRVRKEVRDMTTSELQNFIGAIKTLNTKQSAKMANTKQSTKMATEQFSVWDELTYNHANSFDNIHTEKMLFPWYIMTNQFPLYSRP